MIIPTPHLERLPVHMHGMSQYEQIKYRWTHPPLCRLLEDFVVEMCHGLDIICPAGFVIDGASVPRFLWPIIEPTGTLLEGAVLHDFYYQYGYLLARRGRGKVFNIRSSEMAQEYRVFSKYHAVPVFIDRGHLFGDRLLRQVTIEKHGATVDAGRAYYALKLFGGIAWGKYRDLGPGAFNSNSLGLPGITNTGEMY